MARKKSPQFKRQQHFLRESWFCAIIMFIMCLVFLIATINHAFTLTHWNTNGVMNYTGNYLLSKHHYLRNTHYRFALNNGDIISVPSDQIQLNDNYLEHTELSFRYCRNKSIFRLGMHDSIEIKIPGEEIYIQYGDVTRNNLQKEMTLYAIMSSVCLLFLVIISTSLLHLSSKSKRKGNN